MNRSGMISMIDAVIFIAILSVASVMLFTFIHEEPCIDPMAGDVTDRFLSIELMPCDVMDSDDTVIRPLPILLAALINSGDPAAERISKDVLDEMVPEPYGYVMTMTYDRKTVRTERHADRDLTSRCTTSVQIIAGRCLTVELDVL